MEDNDFGSDDWGEVDEKALVAATTQAEREQEVTVSQGQVTVSQGLPLPYRCDSGDVPLFFESDFDDSDDEVPDLPAVAMTMRNPPIRQDSSQSRGALRQSTLFGGRVPEPGASSQSGLPPIQRSWPLVGTQEPPTHHKVDLEAAKTWIYPTNVSHRDYQYSIVSRALFSNVLVALPTGLGKTLIAATVMLNWFRWAPESQIAFLAPTKPLVAQQIDACFNIVGIPRSATAEMTGAVSAQLRREYWEEKRVFFLTPQTMQNDIAKGICDAKRLVCLVIDEAHRATGNYAYVQVISLLRRVNKSFRVLALTATPGATIDKVQAVIDSCGIAGTEIRNLESIDIRAYVHNRFQHLEVFQLTPEMIELRDLYCKCLEPLLKKLNDAKAYWVTNPQLLTLFGVQQASREWMASAAGRSANQAFKGFMMNTFSTLSSLALPLHFLTEHGVRVFYNKLAELRSEIMTSNNKTKREVINDKNFLELMNRTQELLADPEYSGHPKLDYMAGVVLKHFFDAEDAETKRETRIMVFTSYRNSAEEIVRVLAKHQPVVRPHIFIGQQDSKGTEGMKQKDQIETIKQFQMGTYNVMVATSIGEEGLDIGEVDMIVCYDQSGSSIRLLQRMGRTGRKRDGHVHILLTQGKEEENFKRATRDHEFIQGEIESGKRFTYHHDLSPRIIPKEITCVPDKRLIDIPPENTQPEPPKKRKSRGKPQKIVKKFLMPDGVRTGFMKASRIGHSDSSPPSSGEEGSGSEPLARPLQDPESGLLTKAQEKQLQRQYKTIYGADEDLLVITMPRTDAFPGFQQKLTKTRYAPHGRATENMVRMLARMSSEGIVERLSSKFDPAFPPPLPATTHTRPTTVKPFKPVVPRAAAKKAPSLSERSGNAPKPPPTRTTNTKRRASATAKRKRNQPSPDTDDGSDGGSGCDPIDLISSDDSTVKKRRRAGGGGSSEEEEEEDGEEDLLEVGDMIRKYARKPTTVPVRPAAAKVKPGARRRKPKRVVSDDE